jgi:hypothetical protein
MYADGRGVQRSDDEAVRLYRAAVGQGYIWGRRNLAFMYEYGRGVQKSDVEAARLYKLPAEQGDEYSKERLAALTERIRIAEESRLFSEGSPYQDVRRLARDRLMARAPGADRDVNALLRIVDNGVGRGTLDRDEAKGIILAASGRTSHVSLRTTVGLSDELLRLMDRFNSSTDYFIHSPFVNIMRMNLVENGVSSLSEYSPSDRGMLKGPLIYSSDEMRRILAKITAAEKEINPRWSDFQKFVYIESFIISNIGYNKSWRDGINILVPPYNCNKSRYDDNSLRGLLNGKTICLGFSIILSEFLNRQGIENHINVNSTHAYSVVKLDGRYCVLDLVSDRAMLMCSGCLEVRAWANSKMEDFMAAEKRRFEISLIPGQEDPDLHMVDEGLYVSTLEHVLKTRWYGSLSFRLTFGDQEAYVTQIGEFYANHNKYFQYLYQVSKSDGALPVLVHIRNNLSEFMYQKSEDVDNSDLESMLIPCFDPNAVSYAVAHHKGVLESVYRSSRSDNLYVKRAAADVDRIFFEMRAYRRMDGVVLAVVPKSFKFVNIDGRDVALHGYNVFVRRIEGDMVTYRGYSICSETDFLMVTDADEAGCLVNVLLGDESLTVSARDYRGYAGHVRSVAGSCSVARDPRVSEFLSSPEVREVRQYARRRLWTGSAPVLQQLRQGKVVQIVVYHGVQPLPHLPGLADVGAGALEPALQAGHRDHAPFGCLQNLAHGVGRDVLGQHVPPSLPLHGGDQAGLHEVRHDRLHVLQGDVLPLGYLLQGHMLSGAVLREVQHHAEGIPALGGYQIAHVTLRTSEWRDTSRRCRALSPRCSSRHRPGPWPALSQPRARLRRRCLRVCPPCAP